MNSPVRSSTAGMGQGTGWVGEGRIRDRDRTKESLLREIRQLRRQVARLTRQETERRRVEEAFREKEKNYKELADLLPQTVFETDAEGNMTFVNRHAFAMFGYTREDFEKVPQLVAAAGVGPSYLINISG